MSVADFNNDGIPDIAYSQANNLGTGIAILQSNGDGSFSDRPEVLAGQPAPPFIMQDIGAVDYSDNSP